MIKSVCVFCGSSLGNNKAYDEQARILGQELAKRNITLVYGGGNGGIMNSVSSSCHAASGKVIGIMPRAFQAIEGIQTFGEEIFVDSMHERKQKMNKLSDAFIALPGGFGTFEELLEMTTWSQLSIHKKPIVVLNANGFYNPLIEMIDNAIKEGFIKEANKGLVAFVSTVSEIFDMLDREVDECGRFNFKWTDDASRYV